MIDTAGRPTYIEAHQLRQKYPTMGAATRLRWVRESHERSRLWGDLDFDDNLTARIERDGFKIHVQYTYDEFRDDSWVGTFTDTWQPGAIKHLPGWHDGYDGSRYTEQDYHAYAWFIPSNSAESARRWYTKAGYARHDAWLRGQQQAREDYERLSNITLYELKVTVSHADIELGVDYLGGIDLGDDLPNVDAREQAVIMAVDSIGNALAEAKTAIKAIAVEFVKDATI